MDKPAAGERPGDENIGAGSDMKIRRRDFLKTTGAGVAGLALTGGAGSLFQGCSPTVVTGSTAKKVLILGIDGMDPNLLDRFISEGLMPNFKKLIAGGDFSPLGTSLPPQSPVAWSNFITGTNPGGHGIYDFIHRSPRDFELFLSTSRPEGEPNTLKLMGWNIPTSGGEMQNLRQGPTFWHVLNDHDIPATIFKMPANFPPKDCASRTLSGLGTPDLLGGYGTYSYFTSRRPANASRIKDGGALYEVRLVDNSFKGKILGPLNLKAEPEPSFSEFTFYRDPRNKIAKIVLEDEEFLLKEGEWSGWKRLSFKVMPSLMPGSAITGIVKFYAQQVHPGVKLYVTPINIDPVNPAVPISTPAAYAKELADTVGLFHTRGLPSDTKALSQMTLTDEEYLEQSLQILDERLVLFDYEINRFKDGCLFFYVSNIDQDSHMLWRCMDPGHPQYDPDARPEVKNAIRSHYQKMDQLIARALDKVDDRTTLLILSDHGFTSFEREVNVNSWLLDNGYLALLDPARRAETRDFRNIDWSNTIAYNCGLNGLYLNVVDREKTGTVFPDEVDRTMDEIAGKMEALVDEKTGRKAVQKLYRAKEVYSGPYLKEAPDMILGFSPGYRISDDSPLGEFPEEIVTDRDDKWAGDHCIDPETVPGTLVCNRQIEKTNPKLYDLAPTILKEFGIEPPAEMTGKPILKKS
jgi:predicted AlkP superfamily phosphohydrolase/phosphomutase